MIEVENVCKAYKKNTILQNVTFQLNDKSITTLIGANGVGKSTLLKIITGLEKMDQGTIFFEGKQLNERQRKQYVGYVPQQIALWEHMTITQNIAFFRKLIKKPIAYETIDKFCKKINLIDDHKAVEKLSGGTQRKLNLLIGLLNDPPILILDEPTVGVDLQARTEIQYFLQQLAKEKTIFLTTHLIDEIEQIGNETILLGEDPFYESFLNEKQITFQKIL